MGIRFKFYKEMNLNDATYSLVSMGKQQPLLSPIDTILTSNRSFVFSSRSSSRHSQRKYPNDTTRVTIHLQDERVRNTEGGEHRQLIYKASDMVYKERRIKQI